MDKNKYERAYGFYLLTNEIFSTEYENLLKENGLLNQKNRLSYIQKRLNDELDNLSQEEINLTNTIMKNNILNFVQQRMMLAVGVPRLFPIKIKDQLEHILIMSRIGQEWTELLYNFIIFDSFDETLAPSDLALPDDKEYEDGELWWLSIRKRLQSNKDEYYNLAESLDFVSIGEIVFGELDVNLPISVYDEKSRKLEQRVKKRVSNFRIKHKITPEWEDYLFYNLKVSPSQ